MIAGSRAWVLTTGLVFAAGAALAGKVGAQTPTLPPDFFHEVVYGPGEQTTGFCFDHHGHLFTWTKRGEVWVYDEGVQAPAPLVDLSEEVGNWNDHGLHGFALDPDYDLTGHVYLLYVVDHYHLTHFGKPSYDPRVSEFNRDTIGRITRYTVLDPLDPFTTVDPGSRKVLVGESVTTGIPICTVWHGLGQLVFAPDGTLLFSVGDSALGGSSGTCLQEGIIQRKEYVESYRAQLVDGRNGRIARIDPATGDGVPSNPFFDPAAPRAPRSRVWALGFRNPFRFSLRPCTGSALSSDGEPGVLFVGDVGSANWEEIDVADVGGQNFGWPVFEGMLESTDAPRFFENLDAPNPLFDSDSGSCPKEFFLFQSLLTQESTSPPTLTNPCSPSSPIPTGIPTFVHTRPALTWSHSGPTAGPAPRVKAFDAFGEASFEEVGSPSSGVLGAPFTGNCVIGGEWFELAGFPAQFQGTYFCADFAAGWIRALSFDEDHRLRAVEPLTVDAGEVIQFGVNPVDDALYYLTYGTLDSEIHRVTFGGNASPIARAEPPIVFGASPLRVDFSGAGSSDPNGHAITYAWDFGDGSAWSPVNERSAPVHVYPSTDPTSDGVFTTRLEALDLPAPMGLGSADLAVLYDAAYPAEGDSAALQFDTTHFDSNGLPDKQGEDWIACSFAQPREFVGLIFQEGINDAVSGGWFQELHVQARDTTSGIWSDVSGLESLPSYPGDVALGFETFQLLFDPVVGDAVRLFGVPGGSDEFVSAAELRVLTTDPAHLGVPTGFTASLTVTDELGATGTDTVQVSVDNTPPSIEITSPAAAQSYPVGVTSLVDLQAVIQDSEQQTLACEWQVSLVHDNHGHPEAPDEACASQAILAPHGELAGDDIIFWRVSLTVTDLLGLESSATHFLYPEGDCNLNGIEDLLDIVLGDSLDDDLDGVPDECAVDCNDNGVQDVLELVADPSLDQNESRVPDECEPVLVGPTPGLIGLISELVILEGTPGGRLHFAAAIGLAPSYLASCPDLRGALFAPFLLGERIADAGGVATLPFFAAPFLSGYTIYFQAVDAGNCQVSSIARHTFP